MGKVHRIYNEKLEYSYPDSQNYIVGSNAIKIQNKYEKTCEIVKISEYSDKSANSLDFGKIVFFIIFILGAIISGSLIGYITDFGENKIVEYHVQANDTLWEIASNNNYDQNLGDIIQEIKDINGLESEILQAGQTLLIPSK